MSFKLTPECLKKVLETKPRLFSSFLKCSIEYGKKISNQSRHLYRYRYFHDNSKNRHSCRYALMCMSMFFKENEIEKIVADLGEEDEVVRDLRIIYSELMEG